MRFLVMAILFLISTAGFAEDYAFDGVGTNTLNEFELQKDSTTPPPLPPPFYGTYQDIFTNLTIQVLHSNFLNSNLVVNYGPHQFPVNFPNQFIYQSWYQYLDHGHFDATFYDQFGRMAYCRFPADLKFEYYNNSGEIMGIELTVPAQVGVDQFGRCSRSLPTQYHAELQKAFP